MSRKFNAGRQSDLLLNEKLHKLYTYLEFIPHGENEATTISMPKQTRQTAIPKGALWLQHPINERTNKLRVHTSPEATNEDERWPCLFEGYYHPASVRELPKYPVDGQLWVDKNNILMIYEGDSTGGRWIQVAAKQANEINYDVFNGLDFQFIDPLLANKSDEFTYSVPYESFGKFFAAEEHSDEYVYCHPDKDPDKPAPVPTYEPLMNEGSIEVIGDTHDYLAKAWVHINPYNLNKVTKRLIKIQKPMTYYKHASKDTDGNFITDGALLVVSDDTKINEYDMETTVKVSIANKNKANQTTSFVEGDYVVPYEYRDQYTYFINVPANRTEFYAFKSNDKYKFDQYNNRIGRLLKRHGIKDVLKNDIDLSMYYEIYDQTIHGASQTWIVVNDADYKDPSAEIKQSTVVKFKAGDKIALNQHINDYEIKSGGILLDDIIGETYDYIYAITYDFRQDHTIDGNLVRITKTSLDGPDQMYIGPCTGIPVVFMDGLYLEHYGDNGLVYEYKDQSYITFSGNDVLDEMQILVVSFPKVNEYKDNNNVVLPKEYVIDQSVIKERIVHCKAGEQGALQVVSGNVMDSNSQIRYEDLILKAPYMKDQVDGSGQNYVKYSGIKDAVITGEPTDTLFDKENFPNPLIFYNGLAGYTFVANEVDIDYEAKTVTIYNFGDINAVNGTSAIFAVSLGENNYKGYGVLEDGVLYDENIKPDKSYLIIVDGIVMSPYNEDITIEQVEQIDDEGNVKTIGKITITAATVALDSEYTIIELAEADIDETPDSVVVIYDDMFTPYTIPITQNAMNSTNVYNDCDSAVIMCGPGALVDRASVIRDFDPSDTFVGGQIVKSRLSTVLGEEVYEYRLYSYANQYTVLDPIEDAAIIEDCDNMVTYHVNKGTVMLNPVGMEELPVTVYAYTYVDSVDEKLRNAKRIVPIEIPGHGPDSGTTAITTNRTHLYDVGVNALTTYLNGVMIPHIEEITTDLKSDVFFINRQISSPFIPFEDIDVRYQGQDMYYVLKALNKDSQLTDEIEVMDPYGYNDHCLVMKYFNSEHQLNQAKAFKEYVETTMRNNTLSYIIENVEKNEMVSCRRHWNAPRYDNSNVPNSYMTTMQLLPGIINVYVNGVLLDKADYALFDKNKIMVGFDLVGGQEILPYYKKYYKHPYRVLTDEGFKYIECEGDDEVLIEVREDMTIKKRSYEIKDISYETYSFDILDYDYPKSLSVTKDLIKIYINGVLYDGKYTNINGVITLLECSLEEDPLYNHFKMHPSDKEEYEKQYGEYVKHTDIITFEWR